MDAERSRGKRIAMVIGESLREIAILVAVFAPLDALMQGAALTARLWSLSSSSWRHSLWPASISRRGDRWRP